MDVACKKVFLNVARGDVKKTVKLTMDKSKYINLDELNDAVKIKFNFNENPIYTSEVGDVLDPEDVVDYIYQYMESPSFVLQIKGSPFETDNNSVEILNELAVVNASTVQEPSYVIENLFNTLITEEDFKLFLNFECKDIIQSYKEKQLLGRYDRINLSKSIINHLLNVDPYMNIRKEDFERLASYIVKAFPNESKDSYYTKYSTGRLASGKLYDAYTNAKTKLAKKGLIHRRSRSKSLSSTCTESTLVSPIHLNLDNDQSTILEIVEEISAASTISDELRCKWEITFDHRCMLLEKDTPTSEYIDKFSVLKSGAGYELLVLDAEKRYGTKIVPKITEKNIQLIINEAHLSRNLKTKEILKALENETDDSKRKCWALLILPYVIPVSNIKRKLSTKLYRPSKIEAQEAFIAHYKSIPEADHAERQYINQCRKVKVNIQPKIVFIGENIDLTWVLVSHVKYCFKNPLEAVTACFSVFMGLNIQYPPECKRIWYFVQNYIYKITTKYDKDDAVLKTLALDLEFLQQNKN
ncbi:uncharacterized protein LOC129618858 [Condylostylus longicornis]|uniref:uncharacterized protein LOC129618858 n=1 Tax=Condylostylus longicornis TaxID=2530218 RepID=UPI00244E2968|nr:uncharacterized protein LOC129605813 isoform X2 [Condylostylus longicornis]XP_055389856.1 uncharacterized protein LOC129618858 [Condylostylus longicornis]